MEEFREIIIKSINNLYDVNYDNKVIDKETRHQLYPVEIAEFVEVSFDVSKDMSDHIVFGWLLDKGFKDIRANWEMLLNFQSYYDTTNTFIAGDIVGGQAGQLEIDYENALTITGGTLTTNTINTGDGSYTIGSSNTVSFSGANYTYGIDTATSDSTCLLVQMNPDGSYEFINH